jgi:iron complex outermembrane receptor protein
VPDTISPNAFLAEIDRNMTSTGSFGGSAQAASSGKVLDHDNHLVAGVSVDHGRSVFTASSELGTIDQNLFVTGTGVFIDQPAADIAPVDLLATNTYTGIYATDTLDLTSKLSITAGARFNLAQIDVADQTGTSPSLTSSNTFQRLNPVVGATYKFTPILTGYAGYSEANRAPTPLELGCSDPVRPCMIDNFLISDPPLKQVVSRTVEAGLRGNLIAGDPRGQLTWALGAFRTETQDDIINVASTAVPMFGFFQNAAKTLRQGVEAKIAYKTDRWNAYANYTFVDATYQSALTISSPDNPVSDINGNIFVTPGDHIPGIPAHRFKAGAEYAITDAWKLGADVNVTGSQYLIHDDSNQNPKVPAYTVVYLHSSYQVTKNVEVFGLVNNLFNQHYFAAGTFFSTGFNSNTFGGANFLVLNDPRTFLPGIPLAAYAGVRAKF